MDGPECMAGLYLICMADLNAWHMAIKGGNGEGQWDMLCLHVRLVPQLLPLPRGDEGAPLCACGGVGEGDWEAKVGDSGGRRLDAFGLHHAGVETLRIEHAAQGGFLRSCRNRRRGTVGGTVVVVPVARSTTNVTGSDEDVQHNRFRGCISIRVRQPIDVARDGDVMGIGGEV